MSGLEGARNRRGRPVIDDPRMRRWWIKNLFTNDESGRRYIPEFGDDKCWFFDHGPTALVNHLGKTKSVRAFLYAHYISKPDPYESVVISGECNDQCINPRHSQLIDRRAYMQMLAAKSEGIRANRNAPLLEARFKEADGTDAIVGVEAARLYWLLLAGKHALELWDWEQNIPAWNVEIWALRKPRNELLASALPVMMRDESWTVDRVRKHASIAAKPGENEAAEQEWDDFHEGLRTFAL